MLIGRVDGARLEVSASGMRLIGFSTWPVDQRMGSGGRPLKQRYAERVDAAAKELGPWQRVREFSWEEVTAVKTKVNPLRTPRWLNKIDMAAARAAAQDMALVTLFGLRPYGLGGAFRYLPDAWNLAPLAGWADVDISTAAGSWTARLPIDVEALVSRAVDAELRASIQGFLGDPDSRGVLPQAWPTGPFRPGIDGLGLMR